MMMAYGSVGMNSRCCCGSCTIFSDDFNRADDTDLGADWTEVSGDWSITSNQLRISATTNAIALHNTVPAVTEYVADVEMTIATAGDKARLIVNYIDTDNYIYAEVTAGSNVLLRQRSGGSLSTLATVSVTGVRRVSICRYERSATVYAFDVLGTLLGSGTGRATLTFSTQCGVGTGSPCAGNIDFEAFKVDQHYNEDTLPSCPHCCLAYDDDFNRADSSDITTSTKAYIEDVGDWSIADNMLTVSSANAVLIFPGGISVWHGKNYRVSLTSTASGDKVRITLGQQFIMELEFGTGKVRLFLQDSGGTENLIGIADVTLTPGTFYEARMCVHATIDNDTTWRTNGHFITHSVTVFVDDEPIMSRPMGAGQFTNTTTNPSDPSATPGLETGDTLTGTAKFDWVELRRHQFAVQADTTATSFTSNRYDTSAPCQDCGNCCWPLIYPPPAQVRITMAGTVGEWTGLLGEYIADLYPEVWDNPSNPGRYPQCVMWEHELGSSGPVCNNGFGGNSRITRLVATAGPDQGECWVRVTAYVMSWTDGNPEPAPLRVSENELMSWGYALGASDGNPAGIFGIPYTAATAHCGDLSGVTADVEVITP